MWLPCHAACENRYRGHLMVDGRQRTWRVWLHALIVAPALLAAACTQAHGATSPQLQINDDVTADDGSFVIDPEVHVTTFANGLTVYLRHNETPGYNAEMRLVVNAGSVDETADQSGVAHFLEHMMFNGTATRPSNELIDQLRAFGMEFGADVNAYTSYDETVYQLAVPAGPGTATTVPPLPMGWTSWPSGCRQRRSTRPRSRPRTASCWTSGEATRASTAGSTPAIADMYLDGSAYHDHPPIGTADAIQAMTAERLRAFYDAWYRPDNAAVVVVGDIDIDDVEGRIDDVFGDLAAAAPQRRRGPTRRCGRTPNRRPRCSPIRTRPLPRSSWRCRHRRPSRPRRHSCASECSTSSPSTCWRLGSPTTCARGEAAVRRCVRQRRQHRATARRAQRRGHGQGRRPRRCHDALLIGVRTRRPVRVQRRRARSDRPTRTWPRSSRGTDSRDSTRTADFVDRYAQHFLTGDPLLEAVAERDCVDRHLHSVTPDEVGAAFSRSLPRSRARTCC